MAEEAIAAPSEQTSAGSGAFVKAFLPGLIIGLVVGGFVGSVGGEFIANKTGASAEIKRSMEEAAKAPPPPAGVTDPAAPRPEERRNPAKIEPAPTPEPMSPAPATPPEAKPQPKPEEKPK